MYKDISRRMVSQGDKSATIAKLNRLKDGSYDDYVSIMRSLIRLKMEIKQGVNDPKHNQERLIISRAESNRLKDFGLTQEELFILIKNSGYLIQRPYPPPSKIIFKVY